MSNIYRRICYLLASANFKEKELADFAAQIKEVGLAEFVDDVMKRRSIIARDDRDVPKEGGHIGSWDRAADDSVADKVIQLLVHEAGMTRSQASEELRVEIRNKKLLTPPPLGRRGFRDWLEQLLRALPPSEILHLSTRIRNRRVHQADTDWSLK